MVPAESCEQQHTGARMPDRRALGGGAALVAVYKVIELIGTSNESWEDAAASAVKTAGQSLRDLRVAEVIQQDLDLGNGDSVTFRTKLRVSFKYEGGQ